MLNRAISMSGRSHGEKWKKDANHVQLVGESTVAESFDAAINFNNTDTNLSDSDFNRLLRELLSGRFIDEDDYELDRTQYCP